MSAVAILEEPDRSAAAWEVSSDRQIKQENVSLAVGSSAVYALGCDEAGSPGTINFSEVVVPAYDPEAVVVARSLRELSRTNIARQSICF